MFFFQNVRFEQRTLDERMEDIFEKSDKLSLPVIDDDNKQPDADSHYFDESDYQRRFIRFYSVLFIFHAIGFDIWYLLEHLPSTGPPVIHGWQWCLVAFSTIAIGLVLLIIINSAPKRELPADAQPTQAHVHQTETEASCLRSRRPSGFWVGRRRPRTPRDVGRHVSARHHSWRNERACRLSFQTASNKCAKSATCVTAATTIYLVLFFSLL